MKIAIISDVHGATETLTRVLNAAADEGCEHLWCLGDSVDWLLPRDAARRGDPSAFRLLVAHAEHLLAGNHETEMLASPAGRARLEQEPDGKELVRLVAGLKPRLTVSLAAGPIELVHASLEEPSWGQIESAADVQKTLALTTARLVLCGHTHVPLAARRSDEGEVYFLHPVLAPDELVIAGRMIVNPGAVGYSPDEQAWWAVLTLDETGAPASISWRRTAVK